MTNLIALIRCIAEAAVVDHRRIRLNKIEEVLKDQINS